MLHERHFSTETSFAQPASNESHMAVDATLDYDIAELFAESAEDGRRRRQALIDRIGNDLWARHGVLVEDNEIHDCLARTRVDVVNIGRVLGIDAERGLVIQSLGRARATVHNLNSFPVPPAVGTLVTITYRGGGLQCASENERGRGGPAR